MKDRQDKAGLWTREEANAALFGRHHMIRAVHTWTDTKDGNAGARSVLGLGGDRRRFARFRAQRTRYPYSGILVRNCWDQAN